MRVLETAMPNMNIYIPDDLKARMDERAGGDGGSNPKWSRIAQQAFERELAATQKGDSMEAVVERLRASKAKIEEVEKPEWIGFGRDWASNEAEYEELERVGALDFDSYDDENDRRGVHRLHDLAVAMLDNPNPDRGELEDLIEKLTGDEKKHPSGRQIGWFVEGAQAVWTQVQDHI
jgi:hypothetical protein